MRKSRPIINAVTATFYSSCCRCKTWIVRSRRQDLLTKGTDYVTRNCQLCAVHFESSQFMNAVECNKLVWNAIPSLFDVPNPPPKIESSRRSIVRAPADCKDRPRKKFAAAAASSVVPDVPAVTFQFHSYARDPTSCRKEYLSSLHINLYFDIKKIYSA